MKTLVAIGTTNPAKIKAIEIGFKKLMPKIDWYFKAVTVESGVPAQPMSDAESITGARNRAQRARVQQDADYGVGIEGGVQKIDDLWFDSGWCVIVNRAGEEGVASSAKIPVPEKMITMIRDGKELGEAIDILFKVKNAKQKEGHFGLMTNNVITRTDGYVHGVCLALSRFLHPELFGE